MDEQDASHYDARRECYEKVRECMKAGVSNYYREHPDLLGDERSQRAIKESMDGLACIFSVLDQYVITKRDSDT